jgi:hypothetical protein
MAKDKIKFDDKDHKLRIGFSLLKENGKVNIRVVKFFPYHEELKKSFLVTDDEEFNKKIAKVMGQPKTKYVTLVVSYGVDKKTGMPIKGGGYEIKPFVFTDDVLGALQTNNAEFPLNEHDYILTCTNPTYQNFSQSPSKNSIWQSQDKLKAQILEDTNTYFERGIEEAVAMKASKEQISAWLGFNETKPEESIPQSDTAGSSASSTGGDDDFDISDLVND